MKNLVVVDKISKRFSDGSICNIDFKIPEGYIMGLIGSNGSGKTTIIRSVLHYIEPDFGVAFLITNDKKENLLKLQSIGYVADYCYFPDNWSANDVRKLMKLSHASWNEKYFLSALERWEIPLKTKIKNYSKGMKVRLMIAATLSRKNKVLVLDEPTSGLDPAIRTEVMDSIKKYAKENMCSVIYSTHNIAEIEKIADGVTLLYRGRMIFSGSIDTILNKFCKITGSKEEVEMKLKVHHIPYVTIENNVISAAILKNQLKEFPNIVSVTSATLEEIMLYYICNERK